MGTTDQGKRSEGRLTVQRPRNLHAKYHAHVYFDDERTTEQARVLCEEASRLFGVVMGRVHQKLVGPHPHWSCQLAFDAAQFDRLIPWLDAHREGLNVLVHPSTGDSLADHTTHASWLGEPSELNLDRFRS